MPAAESARLVVAPSLLDDAGRRLVTTTEATATRLALHAAGPRPEPWTGDPVCTAAYATAQHQFSGLVTLAVAQARALARGLTTAAALYSVLDAGGGGGGGGANWSGETLAELGPVSPDRAAA